MSVLLNLSLYLNKGIKCILDLCPIQMTTALRKGFDNSYLWLSFSCMPPFLSSSSSLPPPPFLFSNSFLNVMLELANVASFLTGLLYGVLLYHYTNRFLSCFCLFLPRVYHFKKNTQFHNYAVSY